MKKNYSLLLFIFFVPILHAQPWLKNLPQQKTRGEITFFDYKNAFEDYWAPYHLDKGYYVENGVKKKAKGWKQFKRWEYAMESQINPRTGEFPGKTAQQVYNEFSLSHPQQRSVEQADWKSLGPNNSNGGYSGIGRINCIAFHPNDINTYWVGSAAGGLWVTTDNSSTWTCLTDNNGVLAVSSIIIPPDYSVSKTIYIGTGDRDSWDNRSIGVLKSTDGGATWDATGLAYSIFDGQMVNKLLMDPDSNEVLIAATTSGVYKTRDGGTHWGIQLCPYEFIDLEFQPGNVNTIYGSTKDGKILVSTDGSTFGEPTFNDGNARRIELAVSPAQPAWVYAVASNGDSGLYGIYKSEDSGATFTQVFDGQTSNLLTWAADGSESGGQGWYDLGLAVSPTNPDLVLLGGVNTWGSLDGGISWTILNHWSGDLVQAVHADKHALVFRSNGDVFECNDGGIYLSPDNGATWTDKTNGIVISQMYKLGVSQTEEGDVITGLQDNGTKIHSGDIWFDQIGGDGMECLIDYTDVNIQYGTLYYGAIIRTMDHWQSSQEVTAFDAGDGGWITPYIIDPVNPAVLYAGYSDVWQSPDRGNTWYQISFIDSLNKLQSMAISPSNDSVLYIAYWNQIWKTTNAGGDWTNITNNLPVNDAGIRYISVKQDDTNTIWVALSGYTAPGVYESTDGGLTWNDISAGLPPIPVNTVVENKLLSVVKYLFAGTDVGVYFKKGNDEWTRYNTGLPNVIVTELDIYYAPDPKNSKLRASTYGRGLWETPIPFSTTPVSDPANMTICSGNTATLTLLEYEGDIQWQYYAGDSTGWVNVVDGTGGNSNNYVTGTLDSTFICRAVVSNGADTLYSNVTTISVLAMPGDAGPIAGDTSVCRGDLNVVYSVESIPDAVTYFWSFPSGITGSSSSNSINLNFGAGSHSGTISVVGRNAVCDGGASHLDFDVSSKPSKPAIGAVVQLTCEVQTGGITLVNLPVPGQWMLTNYFNGDTVSGSGSSKTITGLPPTTYAYTVANEAGCVSIKSSNIFIYDHAATPPTPVVTSIGLVLQSDAPLGNQWYGPNGIIGGAIDQEYTATESGDYYTIVTVDDCVSEASNVVYIDLTGVDIVNNRHAMIIYPNPVSNELIIEIKGNKESTHFEILNSLGQIVYNGDMVEEAEVSTANFSSGIYLVKIVDEHILEFRKIVKE